MPPTIENHVPGSNFQNLNNGRGFVPFYKYWSHFEPISTAVALNHLNSFSFKTIQLTGGQFLSISIVKIKFDRGDPYAKTPSHNK